MARSFTRNILSWCAIGLTVTTALVLTAPQRWSESTANAAEAAGAASTAGVHNVRAYGATGDGTTLDSPAINKAIETAAQAGGGTVFVPAGRYLCGSIRMKSNITLHLDNGAVIVADKTDSKSYDPTEPWQGTAYQDGGHTYFHNSLIWGEFLTNVAITGLGKIDGTGLSTGDKGQDDMSNFARWQTAQRGATIPDKEQSALYGGNKAIALKGCRHVTIRDITIFKGGHFAILVTGCDDMLVDNVTMDTNRDGIDIDACRNTVVSNCRINSPSDDGLCPKSTFAMGKNIITENLTITNCQVSGWEVGTLLDGTMKPKKNGNGRIKFGTEANGGFRNITISNCTFRSCRGLALEEVDGGILENVTINNLTMMDVAGYPIYITTGKRNRGPNVTAVSTVRNILISNVVATNCEPMSGIQVTGMPGHPIENVRIENVRIDFQGGGTAAMANRVPPELGTGYPEPSRIGNMPSYGVYARHVKDLELANIKLTYNKEDVRPPLMAVDVQGLEIDNFKAMVASGTPAARLEAVTGLVVRNSPVLEKQGAVEQKTQENKPAATQPE